MPMPPAPRLTRSLLAPPLLALLTTGCAATLARRPHDIALVGAYVGPANTAGERWDGLGVVPPDVRAAAMAAAASMDPAVGLALVEAERWQAAVEPPDPTGRLEFSSEKAEDTRSVPVPEAPNTYTPSWSTAPPTLSGVRITRSSQVRLVLEDADTRFDTPDPLGTIVLDAETLRRVWRNKEPYHMDVSSQTGGQVLTVTLRVTRSGE